MSENVIKVEQLQGGLRAAFVNVPHWNSSSVRLIFHSGSLHESQEAAGASHYLEHITSHGTRDLPTIADTDRYRLEKLTNANAATNQTYIRHEADGYDLKSVGYFVVQDALFPRLSPDIMEKERLPIINEILQHTATPYFKSSTAHSLARRGEKYARPISGTTSDVRKLSHDDLIAFYRKNYRLGNATLVVCSSESVEHQREYMEFLLGTVAQKGADEPTPLQLPDFNPKHLEASLQLNAVIPEVQTAVSIAFGLPETHETYKQFSYSMISHVLSILLFRRLRRELAICYDTQTYLTNTANLNFGAESNWSQLSLSTQVLGQDSIKALDAIYNDVIKQDLPADTVDLVRKQWSDVPLSIEGTPSSVANSLCNILQDSKRETIRLTESRDFAAQITLAKLRKLHRDTTDGAPLVIATSPDQKILDQVGEWARSGKRS